VRGERKRMQMLQVVLSEDLERALTKCLADERKERPTLSVSAVGRLLLSEALEARGYLKKEKKRRT
jgi:hypothetical protein